MFYDHNLQPVLEPDKVKFLWDFTIQTEKRLCKIDTKSARRNTREKMEKSGKEISVAKAELEWLRENRKIAKGGKENRREL